MRRLVARDVRPVGLGGRRTLKLLRVDRGRLVLAPARGSGAPLRLAAVGGARGAGGAPRGIGRASSGAGTGTYGRLIGTGARCHAGRFPFARAPTDCAVRLAAAAAAERGRGRARDAAAPLGQRFGAPRRGPAGVRAVASVAGRSTGVPSGPRAPRRLRVRHSSLPSSEYSRALGDGRARRCRARPRAAARAVLRGVARRVARRPRRAERRAAALSAARRAPARRRATPRARLGHRRGHVFGRDHRAADQRVRRILRLPLRRVLAQPVAELVLLRTRASPPRPAAAGAFGLALDAARLRRRCRGPPLVGTFCDEVSLGAVDAPSWLAWSAALASSAAAWSSGCCGGSASPKCSIDTLRAFSCSSRARRSRSIRFWFLSFAAASAPCFRRRSSHWSSFASRSSSALALSACRRLASSRALRLSSSFFFLARCNASRCFSCRNSSRSCTSSLLSSHARASFSSRSRRWRCFSASRRLRASRCATSAIRRTLGRDRRRAPRPRTRRLGSCASLRPRRACEAAVGAAPRAAMRAAASARARTLRELDRGVRCPRPCQRSRHHPARSDRAAAAAASEAAADSRAAESPSVAAAAHPRRRAP